MTEFPQELVAHGLEAAVLGIIFWSIRRNVADVDKQLRAGRKARAAQTKKLGKVLSRLGDFKTTIALMQQQQDANARRLERVEAEGQACKDAWVRVEKHLAELGVPRTRT